MGGGGVEVEEKERQMRKITPNAMLEKAYDPKTQQKLELHIFLLC